MSIILKGMLKMKEWRIWIGLVWLMIETNGDNCEDGNIVIIIFTKGSSPVTVLEWPRACQEVKVPRFHNNGTGWW
jgi:hypothetical protein